MLERQKHRIKHRVDHNVSAASAFVYKFTFDSSTNAGKATRQESKPALLRFFLDHVLGDRDTVQHKPRTLVGI